MSSGTVSNTTTDDDKKDSIFLAASITLLFVEIFGIGGNMLLVRVMVRSQSVNRSYGLFLITLAFTDSINLLLQMIDNSDEIYEYKKHHYIIHPHNVACKIHDYCSALSSALSAWLLVCITCERFLVVFYPLRGRMWWKRNRWTVFGIVITFFCIVQAPRFYFVQRGLKGTCQFEFGNSTLIPIYFDVSAHFIFVYGVPGTILLVLNLLIILQMRGILKRSTAIRLEEYRKRYPLSIGLQVLNSNDSTTSSTYCPPSVGEKTRRDRQRATCILVAISCTYLIMLAPQCIAKLYWSFMAAKIQSGAVFEDGERDRMANSFQKYYYSYRFVFQNFTAISYGSNFYTYFMFGKRFRAEVTRLLGSSSNEHSQPTQRTNLNNLWFLRSPPPVARGDYVEVDMQHRFPHSPRVHYENGVITTPRHR